MAKPNTVDEYVAGLDGWRRETAAHVVTLMREHAAGADEAIKWA